MPSLVPTTRQTVRREPQIAAAQHELHSDTADLADVWRILWHRRRWVVVAAALLAAIVLAYCLLTPSLYSAKVQILIDPRELPVDVGDTSMATVAPDGGVTQAESQVSIIQSADVLSRAVAETDLTHDPEFNHVGLVDRLRGVLLTLSGKPAVERAEAQERTLTALRRHLTVSRGDKELVIDAAVSAKEPDKAARLANAIADAYLADQGFARAQAARKLSDDLAAHLAEQRKRVEAAADAVERYRAAHNMVAATGQLVSEQQLADVNRQLTEAQHRTALLKARVEEIAHQRKGGVAADAVAEVIRSRVISQLRAQEGTLVQREADLESQLGPRHPALAAVRDQLRDVRRLINAELNRIAKAAQADYQAALADEQALSLKLARLEKQTLSTDQAAVHLKELQRDLDAVRTVYSNDLLKAQQAQQQANLNRTTARVITRALPPLQRSWPPTMLLLSGAVIAGLGLGAGTALLAESLRPTVLSIAQAEALTDAPVVGVLPLGRKSTRNRRLSGWLPQKMERLLRLLGLSDSAPPPAPQIEAAIDLALRRIFSVGPSPDRSYVRSLLVTSGPGDADARDRVARLIAEVAANLGERVLVVDADLAGNQESPRAGLLDVLRGERAVDSVLYFEPGRNAAFVAKGRKPSNPAGRSGQIFARRMLDDARHQFDLMVVNGGAAAQNHKAASLMAAVDEVLLIAKLNVTPRRDIAAAAEALSVMGCYATAALLIDSMAG